MNTNFYFNIVECNVYPVIDSLGNFFLTGKNMQKYSHGNIYQWILQSSGPCVSFAIIVQMEMKLIKKYRKNGLIKFSTTQQYKSLQKLSLFIPCGFCGEIQRTLFLLQLMQRQYLRKEPKDKMLLVLSLFFIFLKDEQCMKHFCMFLP